MLKSPTKSWKYLALLAFAATATLACGSSTSSSNGNDAAATMGTSGVDGSKRLDALTTDEKKKVCDSEAQHFGGYGKTIDCGGGNTLSAEDSQAACLESWPTTCAATVAQLEKCTNDQSCTGALIPASCTPIFQCL